MTTMGRIASYAIAAAAAVGIASSAQAATYNNFDGTAGTFGNDMVSPRGTFVNMFTFILGREGSVTSSISSSAATAFSNDPTNINFSLVQLTGPSGFVANYAPLSTGVFEFRTYGPAMLAAGTYTLEVRGRTGGLAVYDGNFQVAAVPEPAVWGLMILGMGMTGAALRRRRVVPTVRFA